MAELKIALLAGAESKQFLSTLTEQIDRLEGLIGKFPKTTGKAVSPADDGDGDDEESVEADDDDEDFTAKPAKTVKKKAAAADFDDEDEDEEAAVEEDEAVETEEEELPPPPPKKLAAKGKAKKISVNDVNEACKRRAAAGGSENGRKEVLAILRKKFKTESVSALSEGQYQACIDAMVIDE